MGNSNRKSTNRRMKLVSSRENQEIRKEFSHIEKLLIIAQQKSLQSEKDAFLAIVEDEVLIKLFDTNVICVDSPEPIKTSFFLMAMHSEYFRLIFKYTHSKTDRPYKVEIPGISRSTFQLIVNYLIQNQDLEVDIRTLSELLSTSSFLLIPKLDVALVKNLLSFLPKLDPESNTELLESAIDFYQKSQITDEILKETFVFYFSKHSTLYKLIALLGRDFVTSLLKIGCPLFLPYDARESDKIIPIYGYYKNGRKKFLESLPFKLELNEHDWNVFTGVPDSLCKLKYFVFGHHNPTYADFRVIVEKRTTCTLSPMEYRLCAIKAYLNRGWNSGTNVDYVEGIEAEYEHLETGKIVVVCPWNGFGKHGSSRRIEIPKNERITSIQINHGWLIDHIGFTTCTGRNLGQFGTSNGGNISSVDYRTDEFVFSRDSIGSQQEEFLCISPVALFGFKYRIISSAGLPFMNDLELIFTAFNLDVQNKLIEFHGADDRQNFRYSEVTE